MLDDFRRSISAILYERAVSPLYGTFILSWLIWNWKIVIAIFYGGGKLTLSGKVDYIAGHLNGWDGIIYPIITTSVIILFGPLLSNLAYSWNTKWQHARLEKKKQIEKQQLLTAKKSAEILNLIEVEEEKYNNLFRKSEQEGKQNRELKEQLQMQVASNEDLISQIQQLKTTNKRLTDRLEQLKTSYKMLEDKAQSLSNDLDQLTADNENQRLTHESQIADKNNEINKYQTSLNDQVVIVNNHLHEVKKLQSTVEQLQKESAMLKTTINEYAIEKGEEFTDEDVNKIVEHIFTDNTHRKYIQEILTCTREGKPFTASSITIPEYTINYWDSKGLFQKKFEQSQFEEYYYYALTNKGSAVKKKLMDDKRIQDTDDDDVPF